MAEYPNSINRGGSDIYILCGSGTRHPAVQHTFVEKFKNIYKHLNFLIIILIILIMISLILLISLGRIILCAASRSTKSKTRSF